MTPTLPFYEDLRFWLYLLTLIPFLSCWLLYGLRSPWRFEPIGRAMFTLLTSLTSVLAFACVALTGAVPLDVAAVIRVVLLGSVSIAGFLLLRQVIRFQREARRCKEKTR